MERERTSLIIISDEEEEDEEEEDMDRRISPRKRKRVRYTEDVDGGEEDEYEEEEEDEEEDEQPGPSTQNTHKRRAQANGIFSVTCGNKKGILHGEKLKRSETCIECEGRWFAPPAFEEYGGKGSSKKWKASILYENKPLQLLFEKGYLTTKGFKRRQTETTKQKKLLPSNCMSGSSSEESEIQSAEETEEDVKDEDWLPGSEELTFETEEGEKERVGAENGREVVDSEVDRSKEEEDKVEKGEMGDEDMPAVANNNQDNSVFEEMEANVITSTPERSALQKKVKVIVERLQGFQAKSVCKSKCIEDSREDSRCEPMDEDAQTEEGSEQNSSTIDDPSSVTAAASTDPSQTSDPLAAGGVEEENGEEFMQSHERKEDGERDIKAQTGNSPTPQSAPATSSETEDIGSTCNANLYSSTVTDTGFIGDLTGEDCENVNNEHFDMSRSEAGGQPSATENSKDVASNTSPIHTSIKKESMETLSGGLPTKPLSDTDGTTSGYDVTELQETTVETWVLQSSQDSGSTPFSRPSTSCNLDTMDLDQLRREKIKMQIKVLKLQEEYYTQKLKKH